MNNDPLLVRGLVRCYPSRWRRRYGDEYAAFLSDVLTEVPRPRRIVLVLNVLRGAFNARLISLGGALMPARSPLTAAIWAAGLFTVAGLGYQKLTEDPAITAAASKHHDITWSLIALLIAAAIALAALVLAALPTAVRIVRGHTHGVWHPIAVPPLAFAVWYGVLQLGFLIAAHHSVHSPRTIIAAVLVIGTGIAAVAATAWAAATVLRRVDAPGPPRLRQISTSVLTTGMAAATVACLVWGLAVRSASPEGFATHDGILASPFISSWIVVLVLLATATGLAATSTRPQPTTSGRSSVRH